MSMSVDITPSPQDMPDDIWMAAGEAFERGSRWGISIAIMAERNRCAALAAQLESHEINNEFDLGWTAAGFELRGGILGWDTVMEEEE